MAVTSDGDGSAEWGEICDDDGFIYRRRRQAGDRASVSTEAPESTEDCEAELRRMRRKQTLTCLKGLREKYKRELEKWERLSSTVNQLSQQVPERLGVDLKSMNLDTSQQMRQLEVLCRHQSVDELLIQVEIQEAILKKMEEICSNIDAFWEEKLEKTVNFLADLPIWSSPRSLLKSLQD